MNYQTLAAEIALPAYVGMSDADIADALNALTAPTRRRVPIADLQARVPDTEGAKLALACAAHGQILGDPANATDAKIIVALRDYWNVFAGVVTV